jgi:uncharacterized coiled-coil protein SlyX|nr:MAG TPA: Restriction endonuclease [Caudoviricetes sp.]
MNWMYIAIGTAPFALLVGYICGNKTRHRQELQLKSDELQKLESEISQREATLKELNDAVSHYELLKKDSQQELKYQQQRKLQLDELDQKLAERHRNCVFLETNLSSRQKKLDEQEDFIHKLLNSNPATAPFFAKQFADYLHLQDLKDVNYLQAKPHPAFTAAEKVREIAAQKRTLQQQCKLQEYQLTLYETIFPWLSDFKEISSEDLQQFAESEIAPESEYSSLKKWLSPQEYRSLSSDDRLQLALERYSKRQKSNWQIGIEYERYVGYCYEKKGYRVRYNGATEGLEDMGRDLIISKDKKMYVIQCKRWSVEKTIHEKHIFQLYGTTILQKMEHPDCTVGSLFITTTSLSDLAKSCADYLDITVVENFPLKEYPLIKCNVSKDGDQIYHLPFDQQYDRVIINPSDGDFYASTIAEAESKGFRHAWRWSGS